MLYDRRKFLKGGVAAATSISAPRTIPIALVQFDAVPEQRQFSARGRVQARVRTFGAPMLVTNRVGQSWLKQTPGASAVFAASGEVLARANQDGKEEILRYDLRL